MWIEEMILTLSGQAQWLSHIETSTSIETSTGCEPMTSVMPVQCSHHVHRHLCNCISIAEVMGSNPVEDTRFSGLHIWDNRRDCPASVSIISSIHLSTTLHKRFFHLCVNSLLLACVATTDEKKTSSNCKILEEWIQWSRKFDQIISNSNGSHFRRSHWRREGLCLRWYE